MNQNTDVVATPPEQGPSIVARKLAEYRKLAAAVAPLNAQMESLRKEISVLVEATGNYQDDHGYARIVHKQAGWSFNVSGVNGLLEAWLSSQEPTIQSCGKMLLNHRKATAESTYVQVK